MRANDREIIPQEKIAAVTRGLNEAFGVGAFDGIRDLTERPGSNRAVANETEEQIYLQEYFGTPPVSYQAARFYLMKQLAHMFYAMAFLIEQLRHNLRQPRFDEALRIVAQGAT